MICLDTNVVIASIKRRPFQVRDRLLQSLAAGVVVGLPAIALFEMWYGIRKSARRQESETNLLDFLALDIAAWPFDAQDAQEAGDIRAALTRAGTPIGPYDVLIAAQARRRGATLVTANKRAFARVPGLTTEDWAG